MVRREVAGRELFFKICRLPAPLGVESRPVVGILNVGTVKWGGARVKFSRQWGSAFFFYEDVSRKEQKTAKWKDSFSPGRINGKPDEVERFFG